jgi:hypothetical protein
MTQYGEMDTSGRKLNKEFTGQWLENRRQILSGKLKSENVRVIYKVEEINT